MRSLQPVSEDKGQYGVTKVRVQYGVPTANFQYQLGAAVGVRPSRGIHRKGLHEVW